MCGIAGILDNQLPDEQFKPLLDRMGEAQRHRGPDENGSIFDADVRAGLHCSRLSIVDLVTGSQPISNEDRTIHVVLNGEIYNHKELRRGLEERGHRFRTNADTEVIVHLYEEKGIDAFVELNGMFGLAILDVPKRKLLLARDRAGMKPLHYAETPAGLVFGSEIKAVLASGLIPKEPDWKALDAVLAVGFSLTLPDSPDIDESMYQRAVSKHLDSEHHEIEFRAEDIPRLVSKGIRHLEQPFEGPALLDFQIAALTSEHVKVALSGQGADELLAGYPWTVIDPFNRLRRVFPKPLARMMEPAFPNP